jgi:hypothetical protein
MCGISTLCSFNAFLGAWNSLYYITNLCEAKSINLKEELHHLHSETLPIARVVELHPIEK